MEYLDSYADSVTLYVNH